MKNLKNRKLNLHVETLRNLQPQDLQRVAGGKPGSGGGSTGGNGCYPTESEVASGCTVTADTCDSTCSWMWMC